MPGVALCDGLPLGGGEQLPARRTASCQPAACWTTRTAPLTLTHMRPPPINPPLHITPPPAEATPVWQAFRRAGYVSGSAYNLCEGWGADYNDLANRHDHELIVSDGL